MIPNGSNTTLETTMEPEATIGMTIDEGAMAHIMSVLTDLYSDPIAAVIREYSTNAYDSHIEAGITRPIEVTLPSVYAQTFSVRDYGLGLDLDDLYRIYSRYGASTKRESNDVVGMLGLGCKSGLTFTNQFSIVSVKNGVQITALVYLQDNGVGAIDVVDTKATKEPSGVLISIPVDHSHRAFIDKAAAFFRFWPKGTVLVNGEAPKSFFDEDRWMKVDDSTYVQPTSYGYGGVTIVMGNVAYEYNGDSPFEKTTDTDLRRAKIIHFAPIGSVQFAPSRESLMDSQLTKTYITNMAKNVERLLVKSYMDQIAKATTGLEAMNIAIAARGLVTIAPMWRNKPIPTQLPGRGIQFQVSQTRYAVNNNATIPTPLADTYNNGYFYIKNYPNVELKNPAHKRGIKAYMDSVGAERRYGVYAVLVTVGTPTPDWVEWHDWSDVVPFTKDAPKSSGQWSTRTVRGVSEWTLNGQVDDPTLDPKDKYVVYSENQESVSHNHVKAIIGAGYRVIEMTKNRHNKFMREFPNTESVSAVIKQIEQEAWDALTDEDKNWLSAHTHADYYDTTFLKYAKDKTLLDPALAFVVKSYHEADSKARTTWLNVPLDSTARTRRYNSLKSVKLDKAKYPIIKAMYSSSDKKTAEQVIEFLNYIYTTATEGNQS